MSLPIYSAPFPGFMMPLRKWGPERIHTSPTTAKRLVKDGLLEVVRVRDTDYVTAEAERKFAHKIGAISEEPLQPEAA